jgi:putative phosphoesterase
LKIGIISDTHDDIKNTKKAIELFNTLDVNYVFHVGDYVFPGIINLFKELKPNIYLYGVRGNNDGELLGIANKFNEIENAVFFNEFGRVVIEKKEIGIYHGTNPKLSETLIESQIFDLLILGHTHIRRIERVGRTLVLNPGALNNSFFPKEKQDRPNIIICEYGHESESGNGNVGTDSAYFVTLENG